MPAVSVLSQETSLF